MALKSITGGGSKFITSDETIGTTSMEVGAMIEGYLLKIDDYVDQDGIQKNPMYLKQRDGKVLRVFPSGNIKYAIKDGKYTVGCYTQITRVEDVKVKGRNSSKYDQAQDPDDKIDVEAELEEQYKKSAELFAAKKAAEGATDTVATVPGTVVKGGGTKNEQKRAAILAKGKLI
jgi:hypothetical protein